MTDVWLREIDDKTIVLAVLLDFGRAFDIIDHRLLMEMVCVMSLHPLLQSCLSNRTQGCFLIEASLCALSQQE